MGLRRAQRCISMNAGWWCLYWYPATLLFYIGMAFAYFVVFPLAFGFLANTAPEGVLVSTDIASYLSFVMALFMAFGVSFEVPVANCAAVLDGRYLAGRLTQKTPYVLVGAFVVGCC